MRSARYAWRRTTSQSALESRPGLSRIVFGTPARPRSRASAARPSTSSSLAARPTRRPASTARVRTAREPPTNTGDFMSAMSAAASNTASRRSAGSATRASAGSRSRTRAPRSRSPRPSRSCAGPTRSRKASAIRGSSAVPIPARTAGPAAAGPKWSRWMTALFATARIRAAWGMSRPRRPRRPAPSQRSNKARSPSRASPGTPTRAASRPPTSQCARSPRAKALPPDRRARAIASGRPNVDPADPACATTNRRLASASASSTKAPAFLSAISSVAKTRVRSCASTVQPIPWRRAT